VWYQNIRSALFSFVTKHACERRTDRETDKQNYDSQDRASIAARAVKTEVYLKLPGASLRNFS